MTGRRSSFEPSLRRSLEHALAWLDSVDERRIGPSATADELVAAFGGPLPAEGADPADVVDQLAETAEPGLMAMSSGRFFGWVIGGTLPAGLAADWLVSAWDQNSGMRYATPAAAAIEEAAGSWLLDLLGLPAGSDVGFVTGATMANVTGLAAGRYAVLDKRGWNVHRDGLSGSPRVHVFVGAERHDTVDFALRLLGLGQPTAIAADGEGRIRVDALADALAEVPADEPVIVCLQAGNIHSGAFDPFPEAIALAHDRGAWVHVDGAFGLWAAASPRLRHLAAGMGAADSWTTDAHKTLNTPYDCGIAIVADPVAMRSAFSVHASYLVADESGPGDPYEKVPELSRRARGIPVWAVLRSLGRDGVAALVDGLHDSARAIADGMAQVPGGEVLNDVVYTQASVSFGDDERTRAVTARLIADGDAWMSGSRWHDRDVLRVSVSSWATDEPAVERSLEAVRRAALGYRAAPRSDIQGVIAPQTSDLDARHGPLELRRPGLVRGRQHDHRSGRDIGRHADPGQQLLEMRRLRHPHLEHV
jgi:glutamate/tyrosine decarboxylase-like PLP-dependent enzyme